MPLPTFTGLGPRPQFEDVVRKIGELADELTNLMLNLDSLNVVSLTADHIDAGTINAGIVTIRADYTSGAFIELGPNGITINDGSQDVFRADTDGNVTLRGTIYALAGEIGGWKIGADYISDFAGAVGLSSKSTGSDDLRIWAGDSTPADAKFKVYESGYMEALNALFQGIIQASTIIGSLIETDVSGNYPRAEMSNTDKLFKAELNSNQNVSVTANFAGSPAYSLDTPNAKAIITPNNGISTTLVHATAGKLSVSAQSDKLTLSAGGGNVQIVATDNVTLACDDFIVNSRTGYTGNFVVDGKRLYFQNGMLYDVV